jgi:uncharacterized protein (DUF1810 family)
MPKGNIPLRKPTDEKYDLHHFIDAQRRTWPIIMKELLEGSKQSHWMWFTFPQLRGLGQSFYADLYGLDNVEEARAFGNHPRLGSRLREACVVLASHDARVTATVFSEVDGMKLGSSMTLFECAFPNEACFSDIIHRYRGGQRCALTLEMIDRKRSWFHRLIRRDS